MEIGVGVLMLACIISFLIGGGCGAWAGCEECVAKGRIAELERLCNAYMNLYFKIAKELCTLQESKKEAEEVKVD